jgi:hypothetical protein
MSRGSHGPRIPRRGHADAGHTWGARRSQCRSRIERWATVARPPTYSAHGGQHPKKPGRHACELRRRSCGGSSSRRRRKDGTPIRDRRKKETGECVIYRSGMPTTHSATGAPPPLPPPPPPAPVAVAAAAKVCSRGQATVRMRPTPLARPSRKSSMSPASTTAAAAAATDGVESAESAASPFRLSLRPPYTAPLALRTLVRSISLFPHRRTQSIIDTPSQTSDCSSHF